MSELYEHGETWRADDVDDNDPKLAVDMATHAFLDYLLGLTDESKVSAKDVCVMCWYVSKAGMSDDVRRIGLRRHLDSVLDFAERQSQFYKLQVVGTRKQDASWSIFDWVVGAALSRGHDRRLAQTVPRASSGQAEPQR